VKKPVRPELVEGCAGSELTAFTPFDKLSANWLLASQVASSLSSLHFDTSVRTGLGDLLPNKKARCLRILRQAPDERASFRQTNTACKLCAEHY
jgi:hypothetical protein